MRTSHSFGPCSKPRQSDLCSRLQCPLWTCLINDGRKVLGQHLKCLVDRKPEMLSELSHLLVSESRPQLVSGDREILAAPQPGLNLLPSHGSSF